MGVSAAAGLHLLATCIARRSALPCPGPTRLQPDPGPQDHGVDHHSIVGRGVHGRDLQVRARGRREMSMQTARLKGKRRLRHLPTQPPTSDPMKLYGKRAPASVTSSGPPRISRNLRRRGRVERQGGPQRAQAAAPLPGRLPALGTHSTRWPRSRRWVAISSSASGAPVSVSSCPTSSTRSGRRAAMPPPAASPSCWPRVPLAPVPPLPPL